MARDYYEILGVARDADEAALKSAFRKKAMEHHPDRNQGDGDAEGRFKEVNEAYSVLSDANKRAAYDRYGHAGVNGQQGGFGGGRGGAGFDNVEDIFSEMFGDIFGGGGRRPQGPQRGADVRFDYEISLEQAYTGADVEINVPTTLTCEVCDGTGAKAGSKPQTCHTCGGQGRVRSTNGFFAVERTCPTCNGQGQVIKDPCTNCRGHGQVRADRKLNVRIPAGVDDGARIRLTGEGQAGTRGGPKGDLYIFLSVAEHDLFERDGLDLHCSIPVAMATAVLGGNIEVPCLMGGAGCDGQCKLEVAIPEGAQTGHKVKIKGKGMPALNGRQKGDLLVELFVETPTRLNARQKELMREFATLAEEEQNSQSQGFMKKAKRFWEDITGAAAQ
ncbi:molecular chaperone DnaJ [Asticcacaulis sp. ZE23SCel15]|uniref:molecular chaperone DnaJ n=1 Tax=Asticcacaulis sp. ZE23SCel15 TaxID=3059027 RepID=UPI00265E3C34|nr:molecular chaperone DnaJ [Asticcacaulis sp. ZE23SCel15]WKL58483.1 molecular chaperone DnaJ [Asticcacaulis sp. ZE23SCel15]